MTLHFKLSTTMVDLKTAKESLQVRNVYFINSWLVDMCQEAMDSFTEDAFTGVGE